MATTTVNLNLPLFQKNFLEIAKDTAIKGEMYYKKISENEIQVAHKIDTDKFSFSTALKDTNDDFWKLGSISHGDLQLTKLLTDYQTTPLDLINEVNAGASSYTITVGDKIYATFTGQYLDFRHYSDNRGGIWKFTLNGDSSTDVTISTYGVTPTSGVLTNVYSLLPLDTYNVVAEFMGADPLNPPSGGVARGWFSYSASTDVNFPFRIYEQRYTINGSTTLILNNSSNKELALLCRLDSSTSTPEWIPDHGTGTTFGTAQILIDNIDLSSVSINNYFLPCDKVIVSNDMLGRNNVDAIDLVDIKSSLIFLHNSITWNCTIEFLQDTKVSSGYVNMIPVNRATFGDLLIDSRGNAYNLNIIDNSSTAFPFRDNLESLCVIDSASDVFLGVYFDGNSDSFLKNVTQYPAINGIETRFWVQHRDATINKFYAQTYDDQTVLAGFVHQFQGSIFMGKINNAYELFKKPIVIN
jgi:hypothetical protein